MKGINNALLSISLLLCCSFATAQEVPSPSPNSAEATDISGETTTAYLISLIDVLQNIDKSDAAVQELPGGKPDSPSQVVADVIKLHYDANQSLRQALMLLETQKDGQRPYFTVLDKLLRECITTIITLNLAYVEQLKPMFDTNFKMKGEMVAELARLRSDREAMYDSMGKAVLNLYPFLIKDSGPSFAPKDPIPWIISKSQREKVREEISDKFAAELKALRSELQDFRKTPKNKSKRIEPWEKHNVRPIILTVHCLDLMLAADTYEQYGSVKKSLTL